jgi:hypothetical protein
VATPKHQQIIDALKALLLSIEADGGATYWYTPNACIEFADWAAQCVNTPQATVYCISPVDSDVREQTFRDTEVSAELKLSLAHRFDDTAENPFDASQVPNRQQIQSRLIQDATKKLNTDDNWTLGGLALRGKITTEIRNSDETFWKGWAIAHLLIRVNYYYQDDEP